MTAQRKYAPPVASFTAPARDPYVDGFAIRDMIRANRPEHAEAIAKLYELCPDKTSLDMKTGERIPVTPSNIAAWAMKDAALCGRLRKAGLI